MFILRFFCGKCRPTKACVTFSLWRPPRTDLRSLQSYYIGFGVHYEQISYTHLSLLLNFEGPISFTYTCAASSFTTFRISSRDCDWIDALQELLSGDQCRWLIDHWGELIPFVFQFQSSFNANDRFLQSSFGITTHQTEQRIGLAVYNAFCLTRYKHSIRAQNNETQVACFRIIWRSVRKVQSFVCT